jgi:hypothetical protein
MKKQRCLIMALALAGVMLLAGPGLAQQQGGGPGRGPGNQVCTGGPGGTCKINPTTQGNQNCPGPGKSQKRQGMRGGRGGAQSSQTDTQTKAPEAGQ